MEEQMIPGVLDPQAVLDRYAVYAEVTGRERDRSDSEDSDGRPRYQQAAYSLAWFYQRLAKADTLNAISRAFLGVDGARRQLSFGAADEASFSSALLEGRFPLNASQRKAIARALASDVSLIQGPPGTGKTEVILNLASCIVARGMNVAVVANNRKAIDNISDKIAAWSALGEAASENQRRLTGAFARLGGMKLRKQWALDHLDDPDEIRFCTGTKKHDGEKLESDAFERYGTRGWEPRVHAGDFLARRPFIASTIHSLKKCFADGGTFQFDYVIMDEASQCNPLLGLVAMSSAKHVVLVGDVEQLPPIYSDETDGAVAAEMAERGLTMIDDPRFSLRDAERDTGSSILVAIERSLAGLPMPRTFLDEHYRCHPGIIEFCQRFVYEPGGNMLKVKTPSYDGEVAVPIRVRWFEGKYCERYVPQSVVDGELVPTWMVREVEEKEGSKAGAAKRGRGDRTERFPSKLSRTNNRQIEIFMREELPLLLDRFERGEQPSVCVLSPYRGVLAALRNRLELDGRLDAAAMGFTATGLDERDEGDPSVPRIPMFTIHKSQGQEFDIVYLLPGEDGSWEWPWTEAKSLINVAVSRAKRELVIIASTTLMSEETQAALVGERRVISPSENMKDELSDEEREKRGERERFLQKLIDYVRDANDSVRSPGCKQGFPKSAYAFGFHRARMSSVFDSVPVLCAEKGEPASAPERAVENALAALGLEKDGFKVACNVPLGSIVTLERLRERWKTLSEDERPGIKLKQMEAFLEGASHLDFVVCDAATGRLQLAIEVDGSQHRAPMGKIEEREMEGALRGVARRQERDRIKDTIALTMGARVLADNSAETLAHAASAAAPTFTLLRLPTDGTSAYEFRALGRRDGIKRGDRGAHDFVTVEDVLEDQLTRGATPPAGRVLVVPEDVAESAAELPKGKVISSYIRRWAKEDPAEADLFAHLMPAKANLILHDAGFLDGKPGDWHVSERGKNAGIVECREWIDDKKKGASVRTVIRYSDEAAEAVKPILAAALRP